MESAGRVGSRLGKVSELTIIVPLAPGGAQRLRAFLQLLNGNLAGADKVGTVHDMRFVFLDDDTRMLFATTFDGDWDAYIDDFITKIPDYLDIIDSAWEGWPGIRSPEAKDYLAKHQVTAEGWYVGNPDLTVVETRRLKRLGEAVDEFLDKVGDVSACVSGDLRADRHSSSTTSRRRCCATGLSRTTARTPCSTWRMRGPAASSCAV